MAMAVELGILTIQTQPHLGFTLYTQRYFLESRLACVKHFFSI